MPMNQYAVTHFKTVGSSSVSDTPRLIVDDGTIASVGTLKWSDHRAEFEALKVGQSSVVPITQDDSPFHIITDGWRVKRLPDHAHVVRFDTHAKEFVLVTNGKCALDHSSVDAFERSHNKIQQDGANRLCQYASSEAIALRPVVSNGKVSIAWTYRAVDPLHLDAVSEDVQTTVKAQFEAVLSKRRSARFIGRI